MGSESISLFKEKSGVNAEGALGKALSVAEAIGRKLFLPSRGPVAPAAGICKGTQPGHLGVWVNWNPDTHSVECFRILIQAEGHETAIEPISYTLAPAPDAPFVQDIEVPWRLREFLVGQHRTEHATLSISLLLSNGNTYALGFKTEKVIPAYRGRGNMVNLPVLPTVSEDTADIAALKPQDLKAYSDKVKEEQAEARRLEEEARIAREEAEKKAKEDAKKAAAAAQAGGGAVAKPKVEGPTLAKAKCAIIFGSSTGNTQNIGDMLKKELGASVQHFANVTDIHQQDFAQMDCLILGVPTWHDGEMQEDWAAMLPNVDQSVNMKGKKIAIFGLGDMVGYPETYVDAMGELWDTFAPLGAELVGLWPTDGYTFKKSKGMKDGKFMGLVIDIENQDNLSADRVKKWAAQIKGELGL